MQNYYSYLTLNSKLMLFSLGEHKGKPAGGGKNTKLRLFTLGEHKGKPPEAENLRHECNFP